MLAWPTARIAVMGGEQAAKVLLQIQVSSRKARGEEVSEQEEQALLKKITERYDAQTSPYYAAARLWVDALIDPRMTRAYISAVSRQLRTRLRSALILGRCRRSLF